MNPEPITKISGSLVLSCIDLAVCISALILSFVFKSAPAVVLFTIVLPVSLVITFFYLVVDFSEKRSKQAIAAILLLLPTIAVQIWFFRAVWNSDL